MIPIKIPLYAPLLDDDRKSISRVWLAYFQSLSDDGVGGVTGAPPITVSPGSSPIVSLNGNGVTNAYLAQAPSFTIKGNDTAGTANEKDLTIAEVLALIGSIIGAGTPNNITMFTAAKIVGDAPGFTWEPSDGGFYTLEYFLIINESMKCEGIDCTGSANIDGTLTLSSNIHYGINGSETYFQSRLPPGSDDNTLIVGGAGTSSGIRGAHIQLRGSQAGGDMILSVGGEVGGTFALYGAGGVVFNVDGLGNTKINEVSGNIEIGSGTGTITAKGDTDFQGHTASDVILDAVKLEVDGAAATANSITTSSFTGLLIQGHAGSIANISLANSSGTLLLTNSGGSNITFPVDVRHGAGFRDHVDPITSNTTLTSAYSTILGDASGGSFTLTLPSAAVNTGRIYKLLKVDTSTNTITMGSVVLGGNSGNSVLIVQSDGTNWKTTQLYDEGTFTAAATGLTTSPTGTAYYVRNNNAVNIVIPALGGTTNANTFTYTGLPSHIQPTTTQSTSALKGTHLTTATSNIVAQFSASGTIAFIAPNNSLTGWDASSTGKSIAFNTALSYLKL